MSQPMQLHLEDVQTYPRPPALESVPQTLRVILGDQVAAETKRAFRVLETHHAPTYYFPPEDVLAAMTPTAGASFCEWKGAAQYWDLKMGGMTARKAAWSYPKPSTAFEDLAGYLAIYVTKVDSAWGGDVAVTPQPGDFYGGWVTPNLTGIVKGGPGTRHW